MIDSDEAERVRLQPDVDDEADEDADQKPMIRNEPIDVRSRFVT